MPATNNTGFKNSVYDASNQNTGILYTDRRDFYLDPNVTHELYPEVTSFTTFLSRPQKRKKTKDPDFKMFEHRAVWYDMYCQNNGTNETLTAGTESGAIAVDGVVGGLVKGMKVDIYDSTKSTYKGQGIITTVISQTSIKITPIYDAGAGDFADNDYMFIMGANSSEGGLSPEPWNDDLELTYNSAGIMKTPVAITGTLLEMALRGYSKELARLRAEKEKEHKMLREKNYFFSRRKGGISATPNHVYNSDNMVYRTTHGIIPCIEDFNGGSNVLSRTIADYNYSKVVDDVFTIFRDGNAKGIKYVWCGDGYLSYWSKMTGQGGFLEKSNIHLYPERVMTKYGFNVQEVHTPGGILKFVRSKLLTTTHNGLYTNYGIVVDPENLFQVTYRPAKYQTSIQENDRDGIKDQYFCDEGLGVVLPETHFIHKFA